MDGQGVPLMGPALEPAAFVAPKVPAQVTPGLAWASRAAPPPQARAAEALFEVLHVLRLRGAATAQQIATSLGSARLAGGALDVSMALRVAVERRLVVELVRIQGWALTPEGRRWHLVSLAKERRGRRRVNALEAAFSCFVVHNEALLTLCTRWQVSSARLGPRSLGERGSADSFGGFGRGGWPSGTVGVVASPGAASVGRESFTPLSAAAAARELQTIHSAMAPSLEKLGHLWQRFSAYPERLSRALGRVRAGELRWLVDPRVDSYHGVWFELHEDFLLSTGRVRTSPES